jgi:hypothetical protein
MAGKQIIDAYVIGVVSAMILVCLLVAAHLILIP